MYLELTIFRKNYGFYQDRRQDIKPTEIVDHHTLIFIGSKGALHHEASGGLPHGKYVMLPGLQLGSS